MEQTQRLDDLGRTLNVIINAKVVAARQKMDVVATFPNIMQNRMQTLGQAVAHLGQMLQSLSYKSVLSRGYAIVRDAEGNIISNASGGAPASVEFADGVVRI